MNKILLSTLSLSMAGLATGAYCSEPLKPNVVFIFLDDLTHDAIGSLGDRGVITPNIDKLVETGTAFTQTYMMGGWHGAYSVASRSQLLTGRYMWNSLTEESAKYQADLATESTWPQMMQKAGYTTYMTGKWHVEHIDPTSLFDVVDTPRVGGMPSTVATSYNRPIEGEEDPWSPYDTTIGGFWEGGKHWSEVQADVAIDFINKNKESQKPLFMYCAFNAPHDPRQAPKEYVEMYSLDDIEVPENFLPVHPMYQAMGSVPEGRDEALAPYPRTEFAVKTHIREYNAIISHADAQIGRIMEALEESGLSENTIIIFAADNGLAVGQHGFIGKQSLYDHSIRVPLVFSGVDIPQNKRIDELVYLHDIVPTLYDLIGVETPSQVEYSSQADLIKEKGTKGRDYIYAGFSDKQRTIRNERYKILFVPEAKYVYLFDLKRDPAETTNLYGKAKYNKVVEELAAHYLEWAQKSGDKLDLTEIYPEIFKK